MHCNRLIQSEIAVELLGCRTFVGQEVSQPSASTVDRGPGSTRIRSVGMAGPVWPSACRASFDVKASGRGDISAAIVRVGFPLSEERGRVKRIKSFVCAGKSRLRRRKLIFLSANSEPKQETLKNRSLGRQTACPSIRSALAGVNENMLFIFKLSRHVSCSRIRSNFDHADGGPSAGNALSRDSDLKGGPRNGTT